MLHDNTTVLNYAAAAEGSFAFVLYYRLPRTAKADALLMTYHQRFVLPTLALGGTFYLPYRHHYSDTDLLKACAKPSTPTANHAAVSHTGQVSPCARILREEAAIRRNWHVRQRVVQALLPALV